MPKIYSVVERENIRRSLLKIGGRCLSERGVASTSVDYLVGEVHIPKGSFYLFFSSKEHLFLSVLSEFITEIDDVMMDRLQELDENLIVNSLTDVFTLFFKNIAERGIYRFFEEENYALVSRRFEEGVVEAEIEKLKDLVRRILELFLIDNRADVEAFYSALMLLIRSMSVSDERDERTIRLMLRGLVLQLVE